MSALINCTQKLEDLSLSDYEQQRSRNPQMASHLLHNPSEPGILSIDICSPKDIIATGGMDSTAVLFDHSSRRIVSLLRGHSERVTSVKFMAATDFIVTASADKSVRLWGASEQNLYECRHVFKHHLAEVRALAVHMNALVTASLDRTWCFYDLATGRSYTRVSYTGGEFMSATFHPAGSFLGTGTSVGDAHIWNMKTQSCIFALGGHVGPVTGLSFADNGYFVASAGRDGVKLWDLRKLRVFRTLNPYDVDTQINCLEFDDRGGYLGVAGSDIRVYRADCDGQEWSCVHILPDLSGRGNVKSLKFGPGSRYIAMGSIDCNLRSFDLPRDQSQYIQTAS